MVFVGRLLLIGLDCADPELLRELLPELPVLRGLVEEGSFVRLRSIDPPITIPAWMCMFTGRDPGELGVYGFRNRRDYSYDSLRVVSATDFPREAVWDRLGGAGLRSILIGIPGTYPPRPIHGLLVSGFLAPNPSTQYTYPPSLRERIRDLVGTYLFDVRGFRTHDKHRVLREALEMTQRRFRLAVELLGNEAWDFAAVVEIGTDRIHHAFWAQHFEGGPFQDALRDYYCFLDTCIGELLEAVPRGIQILVVSDHGAQGLEGGIAINEWLLQEGYLTLKTYPKTPTRIGDLIRKGLVDWRRTLAWGEGGHYARIFLNVKGREPRGAVPQGKYDTVRRELASALEGMVDGEGNPLGNRVLFPEEIYREVRGIPPDLIVYPGNLRFRSLGSVGWGKITLPGNDTGPDDANHSHWGIFISSPPLADSDLGITQVHDIILGYFGLEGRNG